MLYQIHEPHIALYQYTTISIVGSNNDSIYCIIIPHKKIKLLTAITGSTRLT